MFSYNIKKTKQNTWLYVNSWHDNAVYKCNILHFTCAVSENHICMWNHGKFNVTTTTTNNNNNDDNNKNKLYLYSTLYFIKIFTFKIKIFQQLNILYIEAKQS